MRFAVAAFPVCAIALAAGCWNSDACAGVGKASPTLPDTTTIRAGAATIAIAGESYGVCFGEPERPPARRYVWMISDSSIVAVTIIDSIHASIRGVRPGHAIVTPAYAAGGDPLPGVSVTVVP